MKKSLFSLIVVASLLSPLEIVEATETVIPNIEDFPMKDRQDWDNVNLKSLNKEETSSVNIESEAGSIDEPKVIEQSELTVKVIQDGQSVVNETVTITFGDDTLTFQTDDNGLVTFKTTPNLVYEFSVGEHSTEYRATEQASSIVFTLPTVADATPIVPIPEVLVPTDVVLVRGESLNYEELLELPEGAKLEVVAEPTNATATFAQVRVTFADGISRLVTIPVTMVDEESEEIDGTIKELDVDKDSDQTELPETGESSSYVIFGVVAIVVLVGIGLVAPSFKKEN